MISNFNMSNFNLDLDLENIIIESYTSSSGYNVILYKDKSESLLFTYCTLDIDLYIGSSLGLEELSKSLNKVNFLYKYCELSRGDKLNYLETIENLLNLSSNPSYYNNLIAECSVFINMIIDTYVFINND